MSRSADVAVLGLGALGAQATLHLARAGAEVVGIDRLTPPHGLGSSHGHSRVIREALFEGPQYVPLVRRAFALWDELEQELDEPLLTVTGCTAIGPPDGELLLGLERVAAEHAIPLSGVPDQALTVPAGFAARREARAGWLRPEPAVRGALELARGAGATLRTDTPVLKLRRPAGAPLQLGLGDETVEADRLVVAAGAWLGELLPELAPRVTVTRQVLLWFAAAQVEPAGVWIAEHGPGAAVYGFPRDPHGLKLALHGGGEPTDPDRVDRELRPADVEAVRDAARPFLGELGGLTHHEVCLYTSTPDEHFLLGELPQDPRIVVLSACSGHGFKHSPATGEAAAALALGQRPRVDVRPFALP